MATAQERVLQNKEKIAKKLVLIDKYQSQIEKKILEIKSKGWNPEDRYCRQGEPDYKECYWAICELERKYEAKEGAIKSLKELQKILESWEEKAKKEQEQNLIVQEMPEIFHDLKKQISDIWFEWDVRERESVKKAYDEYKKQCQALPEFDNYSKKRDAERRIHRSLLEDAFTRRSLNLYFNRVTDEQIRKESDKDAESAVMELYYRVLDVTGKVTDWHDTSLHGGHINGIVEGENGITRVETISAGGYNVQRFHLRTLVHKM